MVTTGSRGIACALRMLVQDREIDYEGASGSIDRDENGDLRRGHVGNWRFREDERVENVVVVPFER